MTNAEARFNNSLRPRKPEGSLGRTAQDVHLDSHTAPELWWGKEGNYKYISDAITVNTRVDLVTSACRRLVDFFLTQSFFRRGNGRDQDPRRWGRGTESETMVI